MKQHRTELGSIGQRWTALDSVGQHWKGLDSIRKCQTASDNNGQHWTALDSIALDHTRKTIYESKGYDADQSSRQRYIGNVVSPENLESLRQLAQAHILVSHGLDRNHTILISSVRQGFGARCSGGRHWLTSTASTILCRRLEGAPRSGQLQQVCEQALG